MTEADGREKKTENKKRGTVGLIVKIILTAAALFVVLSVVATALVPVFMFPRSDGGTGFNLVYSDADSKDYPRERFTFASRGNELVGYLYPRNDPKGLVVLVNGIKNGTDAHLNHIKAFYDDGWSVATYDATGVGESGGNGTFGLAQVKVDLFAFLDYLKTDERMNSLPVVLFGHSAGGYAAACALGKYDYIRGTVVISAFDTPSETMAYHAKARVGFLADVEYPFMLLGNLIAFGADADAKAHESVAASDTPVLIVGGSSDDTVPYAVSLYRFKDEIGRCGVEFYMPGDEERNEHSTPWLTRKAAEYVNSWQGGEVDRELANELDPDFLGVVLDFFENSVSSAS
ncbi:MAG: alpha/beta fold hydrolase [Clostridia bacterium]|nr:alpha/beta fold hydrolase [Clostridia bacterium]